jgi:hypothetical protein
MSDTIIAGGHTPQSDWDGALSELESRAELESLEGLQAERRLLIEQNAGLMARYGSFGMHDDFRKRYVEAQKIRARMDLAKEGAKVTESMVDAHAYGSEAYEKFLDSAYEEKVAYLKVQARIDEINERIRSRELAMLSYNAELKLAR